MSLKEQEDHIARLYVEKDLLADDFATLRDRRRRNQNALMELGRSLDYLGNERLGRLFQAEDDQRVKADASKTEWEPLGPARDLLYKAYYRGEVSEHEMGSANEKFIKSFEKMLDEGVSHLEAAVRHVKEVSSRVTRMQQQAARRPVIAANAEQAERRGERAEQNVGRFLASGGNPDRARGPAASGSHDSRPHGTGHHSRSVGPRSGGHGPGR